MVGVKAPEVTDPLPLTVLVEVKAGKPAQLALSGPKRVKVIVPVGLLPEIVAVSVRATPSGPPGEAVVVSVGIVRSTVVLVVEVDGRVVLVDVDDVDVVDEVTVVLVVLVDEGVEVDVDVDVDVEVVVDVDVVGPTVTVSAGSLQAVDTARWATSPEYEARQR
jgi:hypothetical protein